MKPKKRRLKRETTPEMSSSDVVGLLHLLKQNGIEVHVDGGWCVDALLGRQTRSHSDLDIAVPYESITKLRELLAGRGYSDVFRDDLWECNFVLGDNKGREVDVHSYILDDRVTTSMEWSTTLSI